MELITTHLGADFDAFAAMLAARRLHPEAELFFPGSREESLRRMLEGGLVEFSEVKVRQVDPEALTRIVLCDVRQRHRLGVVGEWLAARPGLPVVAYDHHPEGDVDVVGGLVDPEVGATATLMAEEFRRRGITPPALEATILLMGIYEDTGSLTHAATSRRDFEAAGWLVTLGGDLSAVRRWAVPHLDPERLGVLYRMTRALQVFRFGGRRVGVVALELGEFVDELAPLVSRCVDLLALPTLFALFGEGDAVTLIARGDDPGVDLGHLLAGFCGGGGHATAAAARIKGATALETRERLLAFLPTALPPAGHAGELAIADFFVVPAGTTVARAKELLNERRVNAAPVAAPVDPVGAPPAVPASGLRLAGAVTRQGLDAALQHGLGERPVERVMERDLEWIAAAAPAEEVARRILERHPRFVLVGEPVDGRAAGLITRMQVLRYLHGRLAGPDEDPIAQRTDHRAEERRPLAGLIARLPEPLARRVAAAARVSRRHGIPVYLVGGLVRDLLLGRDNRDLDLVVEGDGPHFARLLAAELAGRVRVHHAFLTAVVVDAEGFHIDIATARSEFYRAPAALPEVQTSALRQDLYRRDFTINTLAVRLGPGEAPQLVDYFGGRRDLETRTLRVLHSLSFIDDPTRVLRAVRLELRLGFRLSPETRQLVDAALAERVFDRLSPARLRDELILLLDEPAAGERGPARLAELGVLPVVHRDLVWTAATEARLREAVAAWDWYRFEGISDPPAERWRLLLAGLLAELPEAEIARFADRLRLTAPDRAALVGGPSRRARARAELVRRAVAPHAVAAILAPLPAEDLLLLLAEDDESLRAWIRRDLTELRRLRLRVRGADLIAAGLAAGPWIGQALAATRAARLDGRIAPEEEVAFAVAAARELAAKAGRGRSG